MRVAIIHDYLTQTGGAERVIIAMHEMWPDAPIYTSVYDPDHTFAEFRQMDVRTSFLQAFGIARRAKTHKLMLPLFPPAFEHFDLAEYDVVISNTTGFAKGVITGPDTCHICYCHTPPRFAWRYHEYISQGGFGRAMRRVLPFMMHRLREWDLAAASRVDYFLSNSYNIERRVRKYYNRSSDILYPPVETNRFHILDNPTADYFLVLSRLVGYKRVSLAVEACTRLGLPLKVAGSGPDKQRLEAMAGPTIQFLGRVPDDQVESLMANCRAFIFPGEEDFGITPLEAMASGRPVIALRAGGARETVLDGITGLFFDEPTVESLIDALQRLDQFQINPGLNRLHAESFDLKRFQRRLRSLVEAKWEEHKAGYSHPTTAAIERAKLPVPAKGAEHNGAEGGNGAGGSNGHADTPKHAVSLPITIQKAS